MFSTEVVHAVLACKAVPRKKSIEKKSSVETLSNRWF